MDPLDTGDFAYPLANNRTTVLTVFIWNATNWKLWYQSFCFNTSQLLNLTVSCLILSLLQTTHHDKETGEQFSVWIWIECLTHLSTSMQNSIILRNPDTNVALHLFTYWIKIVSLKDMKSYTLPDRNILPLCTLEMKQECLSCTSVGLFHEDEFIEILRKL